MLNRTNNCQVIVAGESKFGVENAGGLPKIYDEVVFQSERLKTIDGSHKIFLALDNGVLYTGFPSKTKDTLRRLEARIRVLKKSVDDIELAGYSCFEEIFLSFKLLCEYSCIISGDQESIIRAKRVYETINNKISKMPSLYDDYLPDLNNGKEILAANKVDRDSDLYYLYYIYRGNHRMKDKYKYSHKAGEENKEIINREVIAELALGYITLVANDDRFFICKGILGEHWSQVCAEIKKFDTGFELCKTCSLNELQLTALRTKWSCIINESFVLSSTGLNVDELKKCCGSINDDLLAADLDMENNNVESALEKERFGKMKLFADNP